MEITVAFGVYYFFAYENSLKSAEAKNIQARIDALGPEVVQLRLLNNTVAGLEKHILTANQEKKRRPQVIAAMLQISKLIPDAISFRKVNIDQQRCTMQVTAPSAADVAKFITSLKKENICKEAKLSNADSVLAKGAESYLFQVSCIWENKQ